MNAESKLRHLEDQRKDLLAGIDRLKTDGGDRSELEAYQASLEATENELANLATPMPRRTMPSDMGPDSRGRKPAAAALGAWGWRSFGDYARGLVSAARGQIDARLLNAPSSYGSEGTNADGGYAVPPDFREQIAQIVQGETSLLALTEQLVSSSNRVTLPVDTSTPWQTSGGIQADWVAEAGVKPQSKPALGQANIPLHKLATLVPLTDELLEDAPALAKYLPGKVGAKFTSALNAAIVAGDGVGKPLGLLSSPSLVTVTAESGQGAGTVVYKNLVKMWSRLYAPLRQDAVWIVNQDVETQLLTMTVPGANPPVAVYPPPAAGGVFSRYGTVFGRPVVPVEAASELGTIGDIILWAPKQYVTATKAGGMRSDVSIHMWFDQDITAFRFVLRVGGQSLWTAPAARLNGSNTVSDIVALSSTRT